jgi:hypothetical protein
MSVTFISVYNTYISATNEVFEIKKKKKAFKTTCTHCNKPVTFFLAASLICHYLVKLIINGRFGVFTAVKIQVEVFWFVTPCSVW